MTFSDETTKPLPSEVPASTGLRWLVLGVALSMVLGLLLGFPYQHWDFLERSSLFGGIHRKAQQDSEWLFCLFSPPIVAWLVWRMKKSLSSLVLAGSWWGLLPCLLGMLFYWFGYKADTAYPGYVAIQLVTVGLILLLGGVDWLKHLIFPWAFLIFSWPMIPLESLMALPLRMLTAKLSAGVLDVIGIPVQCEGTGLFSAPDAAAGLQAGALFQLDVEEPCSGIRSLFALLMLSALYGWLMMKTWMSRFVLLLCAIPMAMLGNLVRMVMLAVGSVFLGSDVAIGRNLDGHQEMSFFHSMAGFMVFGVALGGLFLIGSWLEKRWEQGVKRVDAPPAKEGAVSVRQVWLQLVSAVIILAGGVAVCAVTNDSYEVGPAGVNLEMPSIIGPFVSTDQPMTSREKSILAEDVQILRRLYAKKDRAVLATLVLSGAEKRSLHSPDDCLPAQGWMVSSESEVTLDLPDGKTVKATLLSMYRDAVNEAGQRARMRAVNVFWYLGSDGTTCASYQQHVWKTYWDAFFKNLNHRWTLLTFFTPLKVELAGFDDPFAELTATEDTKAFITALWPYLRVGAAAIEPQR